MKILVDTHIALWTLYESSRLSKEALEILQDSNNEFYYSTVSVWEIVIKKKAHPEIEITDGEKFARDCEQAGFMVLPLFNQHIFALKSLKRSEGAPEHKDPFDRILIAQANAEGMKFLTHDSLLPYYNEESIICV